MGSLLNICWHRALLRHCKCMWNNRSRVLYVNYVNCLDWANGLPLSCRSRERNGIHLKNYTSALTVRRFFTGRPGSRAIATPFIDIAFHSLVPCAATALNCCTSCAVTWLRNITCRRIIGATPVSANLATDEFSSGTWLFITDWRFRHILSGLQLSVWVLGIASCCSVPLVNLWNFIHLFVFFFIVFQPKGLCSTIEARYWAKNRTWMMSS